MEETHHEDLKKFIAAFEGLNVFSVNLPRFLPLDGERFVLPIWATLPADRIGLALTAREVLRYAAGAVSRPAAIVPFAPGLNAFPSTSSAK